MLATPYSEEVSQNVVNTLLQIACKDSSRPLIPIEVWAWLKLEGATVSAIRVPGMRMGTTSNVVRHMRGLGDIKILKSYLLLVWSEWDHLHDNGFVEIIIAVKEEFCGIAMQRHREDLTEWLDYILGQLDQGSEYFSCYNPSIKGYWLKWAKKQYNQLQEVLLEVGRGSTEAPPGMSPELIPLKSVLIIVGVYTRWAPTSVLNTQTLFRCRSLDPQCTTLLPF